MQVNPEDGPPEVYVTWSDPRMTDFELRIPKGITPGGPTEIRISRLEPRDLTIWRMPILSCS